jgi:hypothetical protein
MFHEGNYEITEFPIPVNGMNQFISPDVLPSNFCYSLENIIPNPMGVGQVRYGTSLIYTFENPEFNIIKCFPFTTNTSHNQGILYVSYYSQDLGITALNITDASHINFNSATPNNYVQDTKIKIVYTFNAVVYTLYSDLQSVVIAGNLVTIILENNLLPDPTSGTLVITQIWAQFGSIYSYDFNTNTLSGVLRTGLSVACVPRATYFQQILMICNGVNNVMYWDGTNLNDVSEMVIELGANNFTRIDNTNFSFNSFGIFDQTKYFIGNSIKLTINGVNSALTIANFLIIGTLVTITTNEILPAFPGGAQIVLFYQDKPPTFSYIYAAKDRIWALGPGAVGLQSRDINDQLRVYYSYLPNAVTGYGLFNENTKTIPSIDMSDKHEIQDNFEAICQVNGLMAFMGRQRTQVWGGYTPGQGGNFSWQSNLPVGIVHGDLLIELANDVYFVSQYGLHSFSTLNIARQFAASPDDSVDPIVRKFTSDATLSNSNYRACASFKYNQGGISGFKISKNKILSSLFSTKLYSWFYLSGDFRSANCFMDFGSQFYLCVANNIYQYADGNDGSPTVYGDQNGTSLIPISWIPGLIRQKSTRKGYANKRYELVINYSSSFFLNVDNIIQVSVFGDMPNSFSLNDTCYFEDRGDLIGSEPLVKDGGQDDPGFRLRKEYHVVNKRLKFSSSSFWISISGYVMNGPITFKRIRLFGIGERNA